MHEETSERSHDKEWDSTESDRLRPKIKAIKSLGVSISAAIAGSKSLARQMIPDEARSYYVQSEIIAGLIYVVVEP